MFEVVLLNRFNDLIALKKRALIENEGTHRSIENKSRLKILE